MKETKAKKLAVFSSTANFDEAEPETAESPKMKTKKKKELPALKKVSVKKYKVKPGQKKPVKSSRSVVPKRKSVAVSQRSSKLGSTENSKVNKSTVLPALRTAVDTHRLNNSSYRGSNKPSQRYNFFEEIKGDKNKVKAFISESQVLNHSKSQHIGGILNKSQFWEDRLKSFNVSADMKERMMQMKNQKSLFLLRNHFQEHTQKEMQVLARKQSDLYKELNVVMNSIKKQQKQIAQQQSVLNNMPTAGELSHIDLEDQLRKKQVALEGLKMQLKKHDDFKDRMERVIHVCEINKIQNEDWIRNLNFYKSNLQTVTQEMKTKLDSL